MMDDAAPGAVLDPRVLPEPHVETVEQALVAPMPDGRELACGVFREDGSLLRSVEGLEKGDSLRIRLLDGEVQARIDGVSTTPGGD